MDNDRQVEIELERWLSGEVLHKSLYIIGQNIGLFESMLYSYDIEQEWNVYTLKSSIDRMYRCNHR